VYATRRVQVKQRGLKLNGAQQLLVYADDFNMLKKSVHTVKKNAESLLVVSKEIELEVNADNIKYTAMSSDQNTATSHSTKTDNIYFERM
jgi:hypothetical protein